MKSETSASTIERRLDPRTEELLREIAASGESCLLRASRRELDDALTRTDYLGLRTELGFSSAERELLRTSRAEVAYWLNVMCFKRLTEDESTRRYCTRLTEGDREYIAPTLDAAKAGLRESSANARDFGAVDAPLDALLERLVASDLAHPIDVRDLAAASLRLHPTFQARHYAVQASVSDQAAVSLALRSSDRLIETSCGRYELGHSLSLAGTINGLAGRSTVALDRYARASELLPTHSELVIRALAAAVHARDDAKAASLAAELERRGDCGFVWKALLVPDEGGAPVFGSARDRLARLTRGKRPELRRNS